MKNLIKVLMMGLLVVGMANCGSDGGGGAGAAPAPKSNAATNADEIEFTDANGNTITWTNSLDDIYTTSNRPNCVYGISEGSGDTFVRTKIRELAALINNSTISKGLLDDAESDSRYLTINYRDGSSRTFNLDADKASKDEDVLSNSDDILSFFDDMADEIDDRGQDNCSNGKGDK